VRCVQWSDALSSVYRRFSPAEPELANGFAEHAPMGAEAMLELGAAPERVLAWADLHHPSHDVVASSTAIGDARTVISAEVEALGWRAAAEQHVARLMPYADAHLFHGMIRTAHAVRALERGVGVAGQHELTTALACWTAWAPVPSAWPEAPTTGRVDEAPDDAPADAVEAILDAATRGAAAHLLRPSIVTLHAVTAPMALLLLIGLVEPSVRRQGAEVLGRTHARYPPAPSDRGRAGAWPDDVADRVVMAWDAHPAKLAEASQRAHRMTGAPVFIDVVDRIGRA
jgi:hypothetical protein